MHFYVLLEKRIDKKIDVIVKQLAFTYATMNNEQDAFVGADECFFVCLFVLLPGALPIYT